MPLVQGTTLGPITEAEKKRRKKEREEAAKQAKQNIRRQKRIGTDVESRAGAVVSAHFERTGLLPGSGKLFSFVNATKDLDLQTQSDYDDLFPDWVKDIGPDEDDAPGWEFAVWSAQRKFAERYELKPATYLRQASPQQMKEAFGAQQHVPVSKEEKLRRVEEQLSPEYRELSDEEKINIYDKHTEGERAQNFFLEDGSPNMEEIYKHSRDTGQEGKGLLDPAKYTAFREKYMGKQLNELNENDKLDLWALAHHFARLYDESDGFSAHYGHDLENVTWDRYFDKFFCRYIIFANLPDAVGAALHNTKERQQTAMKNIAAVANGINPNDLIREAIEFMQPVGAEGRYESNSEQFSQIMYKGWTDAYGEYLGDYANTVAFADEYGEGNLPGAHLNFYNEFKDVYDPWMEEANRRYAVLQKVYGQDISSATMAFVEGLTGEQIPSPGEVAGYARQTQVVDLSDESWAETFGAVTAYATSRAMDVVSAVATATIDPYEHAKNQAWMTASFTLAEVNKRRKEWLEGGDDAPEGVLETVMDYGPWMVVEPIAFTLDPSMWAHNWEKAGKLLPPKGMGDKTFVKGAFANYGLDPDEHEKLVWTTDLFWSLGADVALDAGVVALAKGGTGLAARIGRATLSPKLLKEVEAAEKTLKAAQLAPKVEGSMGAALKARKAGVAPKDVVVPISKVKKAEETVKLLERPRWYDTFADGFAKGTQEPWQVQSILHISDAGMNPEKRQLLQNSIKFIAGSRKSDDIIREMNHIGVEFAQEMDPGKLWLGRLRYWDWIVEDPATMGKKLLTLKYRLGAGRRIAYGTEELSRHLEELGRMSVMGMDRSQSAKAYARVNDYLRRAYELKGTADAPLDLQRQKLWKEFWDEIFENMRKRPLTPRQEKVLKYWAKRQHEAIPEGALANQYTGEKLWERLTAGRRRVMGGGKQRRIYDSPSDWLDEADVLEPVWTSQLSKDLVIPGSPQKLIAWQMRHATRELFQAWNPMGFMPSLNSITGAFRVMVLARVGFPLTVMGIDEFWRPDYQISFWKRLMLPKRYREARDIAIKYNQLRRVESTGISQAARVADDWVLADATSPEYWLHLRDNMKGLRSETQTQWFFEFMDNVPAQAPGQTDEAYRNMLHDDLYKFFEEKLNGLGVEGEEMRLKMAMMGRDFKSPWKPMEQQQQVVAEWQNLLQSTLDDQVAAVTRLEDVRGEVARLTKALGKGVSSQSQKQAPPQWFRQAWLKRHGFGKPRAAKGGAVAEPDFVVSGVEDATEALDRMFPQALKANADTGYVDSAVREGVDLARLVRSLELQKYAKTGKWPKGINPRALAIWRWSLGGEGFNAKLRAGESIGDEAWILKYLDSAAEAAPRDMSVVRMLSGGEGAWSRTLKAGDTFTDKGYASASIARDWMYDEVHRADDVFMIVRVKKGDKLIPTDVTTRLGLGEVTIPRGTTYRVLGKRKMGGKDVFDVEIIRRAPKALTPTKRARPFTAKQRGRMLDDYRLHLARRRPEGEQQYEALKALRQERNELQERITLAKGQAKALTGLRPEVGPSSQMQNLLHHWVDRLLLYSQDDELYQLFRHNTGWAKRTPRHPRARQTQMEGIVKRLKEKGLDSPTAVIVKPSVHMQEGYVPGVSEFGEHVTFKLLDVMSDAMNRHVFVDHFRVRFNKLVAAGWTEREAAHAAGRYAQNVTEKILYQHAAAPVEYGARNAFLFIPAYRQAALYWGRQLLHHPFLGQHIREMGADKWPYIPVGDYQIGFPKPFWMEENFADIGIPGAGPVPVFLARAANSFTGWTKQKEGGYKYTGATDLDAVGDAIPPLSFMNKNSSPLTWLDDLMWGVFGDDMYADEASGIPMMALGSFWNALWRDPMKRRAFAINILNAQISEGIKPDFNAALMEMRDKPFWQKAIDGLVSWAAEDGVPNADGILAAVTREVSPTGRIKYSPKDIGEVNLTDELAGEDVRTITDAMYLYTQAYGNEERQQAILEAFPKFRKIQEFWRMTARERTNFLLDNDNLWILPYVTAKNAYAYDGSILTSEEYWRALHEGKVYKRARDEYVDRMQAMFVNIGWTKTIKKLEKQRDDGLKEARGFAMRAINAIAVSPEHKDNLLTSYKFYFKGWQGKTTAGDRHTASAVRVPPAWLVLAAKRAGIFDQPEKWDVQWLHDMYRGSLKKMDGDGSVVATIKGHRPDEAGSGGIEAWWTNNGVRDSNDYDEKLGAALRIFETLADYGDPAAQGYFDPKRSLSAGAIKDVTLDNRSYNTYVAGALAMQSYYMFDNPAIQLESIGVKIPNHDKLNEIAVKMNSLYFTYQAKLKGVKPNSDEYKAIRAWYKGERDRLLRPAAAKPLRGGAAERLLGTYFVHPTNGSTVSRAYIKKVLAEMRKDTPQVDVLAYEGQTDTTGLKAPEHWESWASAVAWSSVLATAVMYRSELNDMYNETMKATGVSPSAKAAEKHVWRFTQLVKAWKRRDDRFRRQWEEMGGDDLIDTLLDWAY